MEYLDLTTAKVRDSVQNFSISFPSNIVDKLDEEAAKLGVTRTALIKSWVEERLANRKG